MTHPDDQPPPVPDEPVMPVEIGEVVAGKYRVGRIVGIGGMATVVAAHHLELDQPIAIKFLLPEAAARPDAVRRFLSEARAAARLNSPHVARVLDVGTAPTAHAGIVPFMVMELLEGMDLDTVLAERGRLPVHEAVEYVIQACAGVAEAHALGIIHRDLKPANLFVTRRRDGIPLVKLLDFGISKNVARKHGPNEAALTADQDIIGSPRYMSPEQARASKDVDTRTDVWALGVILHELLAGVAPFTAETIADTLVAILHSAPQPIARTAPEVPGDLVEIVMRCLQKMPDGRYSSVDELAAALAPYRSTGPLVGAPLPERVEEARSAEAGVSVQTVRPAVKGRILRTGVLSLGAVGLALLAFVAFSGPRGATPPPVQGAGPAAEEAPAKTEALPGAATVTVPVAGQPPEPPTEEFPDDGTTTPANGKPASSRGAPKPGLAGTRSPSAKPGASSSPRHRTPW